MLDEHPGSDHEAPFDVSSDHELLDEEPCHDGLASAGIVREEKAKGLTREHLPVHGRDLVGERIDARGVDRDVRVEEVRETDPVRLGDEPKERAVTVEGPGTPGLDQLQGGLLVAVDEAIANRACGILERELRGLIAEPLALHDLGGPAGCQSLDVGSRLQVLKVCHSAEYTGSAPLHPKVAPNRPRRATARVAMSSETRCSGRHAFPLSPALGGENARRTKRGASAAC